VGRFWRWFVVSVAGVGAFTGTWAACQALLAVDVGTAQAWAGLAAAIVMTPLGVWASFNRNPLALSPPHVPALTLSDEAAAQLPVRSRLPPGIQTLWVGKPCSHACAPT
jgi:hypothetical protein